MSDAISNVDLDLTGISVSRPLFDGVVVRCRIGEARIESEEGRSNLVIPLQFEAAATSTDGREVTPGFQHTDRINLVVSGNRTPQMVKETIARFQCAALGLKEPKPGRFEASDVVGKLVDVRFSTRADRSDSSKFYQDCKYIAAK